MILRLVIALSLVFSLSACGSKSPLLMPDGKPTPKHEKDPSEPPTPISR